MDERKLAYCHIGLEQQESENLKDKQTLKQS